MLGVHGGRLALKVVEPAQALSEDRTVRLDAQAVASLKAIPGVIALQKCPLDVGIRVEDQGRYLLVIGSRIELFAKPAHRRPGAYESEMPDLSVRIPPGLARPRCRPPHEHLGPEFSNAGAELL